MHQPNATKVVFMDFESVHEILDGMENDTSLDTKPRPIKGLVADPDSLTFREIHLLYLQTHPKVNPQHYLSNLKAMIKIRSAR